MAIYTSLFAVVILTTGSAQAATKCTKYESGTLITGPFDDKTGQKQVGLKPYAFNSRNELAYYTSGNHPNITVEFQYCEPNYAQSTKKFDSVYGRFYIPSLKKCLAVTNPSGPPPYYVAAKPCIPEKDMSTTASIPFNFYAPVADGGLDWNNYAWSGGTIPDKQVYHGVEPYAKNCYGMYTVNATNLQHGHNYGDNGQPSVSGSDKELNRIHLNCPDEKGQVITSYTVFRMDDGSRQIPT